MNKPSPMSMLCEQTPVVILAGGKGTRLKPYTTSLPKPLMPVGEYPILDILLRQLGNQGFKRITLAVGHLAGLIQAYFKQGQDWGVELDYAYETTPLGTAGPIARLPRDERALLVLTVICSRRWISRSSSAFTMRTAPWQRSAQSGARKQFNSE